MVDRERARELAAGSGKDPSAWFDQLYTEAESGRAEVPWDDRRPNRGLVELLESRAAPADGARAIVVGCGLGDDAEYLAGRGYATTAFDIAPAAIRGCRARYPATTVDYEVADVRELPERWHGKFDLVVECFTLQAVPPAARRGFYAPIAGLVRQGGELVVVARARGEDDPVGELPWPLTRAEVEEFTAHGLRRAALEEYSDGGDPTEPPVRRWRGRFERPVAGPPRRRR